MRSKVSIGLALAVLAGCTTTLSQPTKAAPEPVVACDAAKASTFVGQKAADAAEPARIAAGAKSVRVLAPDQAATMDFRADRLNLDTDAAGVILKARCG